MVPSLLLGNIDDDGDDYVHDDDDGDGDSDVDDDEWYPAYLNCMFLESGP